MRLLGLSAALLLAIAALFLAPTIWRRCAQVVYEARVIVYLMATRITVLIADNARI